MKRAKNIRKITEISLVCLILLGFMSVLFPGNFLMSTRNNLQTSVGSIMPENMKYSSSGCFVIFKGITYALAPGFSGRNLYQNNRKYTGHHIDKYTGQGRINIDNINSDLFPQVEHLVKIHRWYIYLVESSGSEELPA
jgi:hypothetical protein